MSSAIDLHTHSTASDGTLTPGALVELAAARGVEVLALTDHDLTDGLDEAQQAALRCGIRLVPGVEISVSWRGGQTVHVVGLGIDPTHPELRAGLARLRDYRDWRAGEIARRLEKAGIPGALEGARRHARGGIVGRMHFGRFLIESGRARDMRAVFRRFLVRNRPGYVAGDWAALDEAVGWIRAAGGVAVLAHPFRYRLTATRLRELIDAFRSSGGAAIEVVSGHQQPSETAMGAELAERYVLYASRGSDYHGPSESGPEPGQVAPLPPRCRPVTELLNG